MITKMKKLTFLIHNGEYEGFLEQLRSLGVVHVIQTQQGAVQDAALQEDINLLARYKNALKVPATRTLLKFLRGTKGTVLFVPLRPGLLLMSL